MRACMCVCARVCVCVYLCARVCVQASVEVVCHREREREKKNSSIKIIVGGGRERETFWTPVSSREIIIMSAGVKTTTLLPQLFVHRNPSRRYNCEVITACVRYSVSVGLLLSELFCM